MNLASAATRLMSGW